jgi:putative transcriptional regulator
MPRLAHRLLFVAVLALTGLAGAAATSQESDLVSLKGQLLVAAPEMRDPNFTGTVVYLLEHDHRGAMGLVINRLLAEGPIGELLHGLERDEPVPDLERPIRVFEGGPVGRDQVFVLHSDDAQYPDTKTVAHGIAVTPSTAMLRDLAAGRGPRQSLLVIGYAGWAPGQLERELGQGAWIVVEGDRKLVFDPDVTAKWDSAFARRGIDL